MESGKFLPGPESLVVSEGRRLDRAGSSEDAYGAAEARGIELLEYWRILVKRRWIVITCLVMMTTLAVIAVARATRLYEGSVRIAINKETSDILGEKQSNEEDWDYTVQLDTQSQIIRSEAIALQVIKSMKLDSDPYLAAGLEPKKGWFQSSQPDPMQVDSEREATLLERFDAHLRVSKVPHTRLISLQFLHPDPKKAAEIANAVATNYIEHNFRTKYDSTMQASEWLSKQLAELQMKVETSQEKLVRYQREKGIVGIDDKENIVTARLDQLNQDLTAAEADRIQKEANYRLAQSHNPDLIIRLDAASLIEKLRGQEADLQTQLAQLTTQFGPNYPKVNALNNQLKELQNRITLEMERLSHRYKAEYLTALEREKMLRSSLEAQKQAANQLNESAIEFTILKRESETNRQLYDGLLSKLKEAGVSAGLRSSNIRIVDAARVPMNPARPNVPLYLGLGIMVGLVTGVGLAFVVDGMDNTVATPEQAQSISGLPSLAVIPLNDGAKGAVYARRMAYGRGRKQLTAGANGNSEAERKRVALVAHAFPQSQIAESYRALRTSILLSSLGHPPKVILVTSALPQEGKTTTSMNTAVVLAQRGGKVLLVDADMRRPSVHRVFGLRPSSGLSTLLSGLDQDKDVILPAADIPNLFVLPAGPIAPQPSELLASAEMKENLRRWRQEYDHIVIDTPPVLSVTDAVVLSVDADAVVLVIRSGSTSKQALRHSRDLLMNVNARVRGIVVNGFDPRSPDAYQYYYYYGSKYANDYFEADAK